LARLERTAEGALLPHGGWRGDLACGLAWRA
jgi:hypothetical protein